MKRVLFVCIHNSARSQMAEAFLNHLGAGVFEAESAGLEPGRLNPRVIKVMQEVGIDISQNPTKSTDDLLRLGKHYDIVVTVCDGASGQRCPMFPGVKKNYHWDLADPSSFQGEEETVLQQVRLVRDEIKRRIEQMVLGNIQNDQDIILGGF